MGNLFLAPEFYRIYSNYLYRFIFCSPNSTRQSRERNRIKTCVGWTKKKKQGWLTAHLTIQCCLSSPLGKFMCMCLASVCDISLCVGVCASAFMCCITVCVGVYARVWVSFTVSCACVKGKKNQSPQCLSLWYLMCECVMFGTSQALFCDSLLHPVQLHWVVSCTLLNAF